MHLNASTVVSAPTEGQGSAPLCGSCEKPFASKRRWQRFCTTACRNEWHHRNAMPAGDRIAGLERRVKALEEEISMVRGHLVL